VADPLVSVVTPSLNQGRFIGDALASVAGQDYAHVEHIVVDGGSKDETREAVEPFLGRITWVSEPDRGQSDALNKGFRLARGEILTWLNADDLLYPDAIGRVVSAFEQHPGAGLVYGAGRYLDESGAMIADYKPVPHWGHWELANIVDFVFQPAGFFSRAAFADVGPVREDLDYTMDWDIFLRIAGRFNVVCLEGPPLAGARQHGSMKTLTGGLLRLAEIWRLATSHSGRRVPPSALLYTVQWAFTTMRSAAYRVDRGLDAFPMPGSRDWLATAEDRLTNAIYRRLPIVHYDGWAGRRVRTELPPGGSEIVITGMIPEWIPIDQQCLTFRLEGRVVRRTAVEPGTFEIRLPAPAGGPVEIQIDASRSFVPERCGFPEGDLRKLAWMVGEIRWDETGGARDSDSVGTAF
jgi:Glycosyl transferase family 2